MALNSINQAREESSGSILAVFTKPEQARVAFHRLSDFVDPSLLEAVPLAPGRYRLADINRAVEARSAFRGASAGAVLGAMGGLGVAALTGFGLFPALGWAAAGALGGLITAGLRSLGRTEWDDEGHAVVDVPKGGSYTLLIVKLHEASDRPARERIVRTLARNGAIAFIDPSAYVAHGRMDAARFSTTEGGATGQSVRGD
jgi:hypothetical protein